MHGKDCEWILDKDTDREFCRSCSRWNCMNKSIKKRSNIEICGTCKNTIWNPKWWEELGMCGPCTTGESAEMFHETWIAVDINCVDDDNDLFKFWLLWYEGIYLKGITPPPPKKSDRIVLGLKV